jgi:hypothetical protein
MGSFASDPPSSTSGDAGGQRRVISSGSAFSRGGILPASGFSAGQCSRCSGRTFCRKRRKWYAVTKSFSAARRGSRPLESTASIRTRTLEAAAAIMRGRKKAG